MRIAEPQFLLLILFLIPLWLFLIRELKLKRKVGFAFGWDAAKSKSKQIAKGIVFSFLVMLLVFAIAGPQVESYEDEAQFTSDTEIAFCFDVSRSMGLAKKDVNSPSRIDRSKSMAFDVLNKILGARVAVFGQTNICQELVPLTTDLDLVRSTIEFLIYTESIGGTGSFLGQALKKIAGKFEQNNHPKHIIIFTDGEFNEDSKDFLLLDEAISELKAKNIKVILIGVGEIAGIKIPVVDESGQIADYHISALDENNLERIAARLGGVYLNEKNKDEISGHIERSRSESGTDENFLLKRKVYKDIYWIFLVPALVCWWIILRKYS